MTIIYKEPYPPGLYIMKVNPLIPTHFKWIQTKLTTFVLKCQNLLDFLHTKLKVEPHNTIFLIDYWFHGCWQTTIGWVIGWSGFLLYWLRRQFSFHIILKNKFSTIYSGLTPQTNPKIQLGKTSNTFFDFSDGFFRWKYL